MVSVRGDKSHFTSCARGYHWITGWWRKFRCQKEFNFPKELSTTEFCCQTLNRAFFHEYLILQRSKPSHPSAILFRREPFSSCHATRSNEKRSSMCFKNLHFLKKWIIFRFRGTNSNSQTTSATFCKRRSAQISYWPTSWFVQKQCESCCNSF